MSKYGKIRAVVIQSVQNKKRCAIYTNGPAQEIGAEAIVQLICGRWGEENAIKELLHKHVINYTPGYVAEELEEQPMVDNPQVRELKRKRAGLVSELNRLKIELADHMLPRSANKRRPPPRSQKEVRDSIAVAQSEILLTDGELDKLPAGDPLRPGPCRGKVAATQPREETISGLHQDICLQPPSPDVPPVVEPL